MCVDFARAANVNTWIAYHKLKPTSIILTRTHKLKCGCGDEPKWITISHCIWILVRKMSRCWWHFERDTKNFNNIYSSICVIAFECVYDFKLSFQMPFPFPVCTEFLLEKHGEPQFHQNSKLFKLVSRENIYLNRLPKQNRGENSIHQSTCSQRKCNFKVCA